MKFKEMILVILSILNLTTCAKILGIVSYPSYSHQATFQRLWTELSLRGHQVTSLTTHPIHNPALINLTEIDLSSTRQLFDPAVRSAVANRQIDGFREYVELIEPAITFVDKQLGHPRVHKLIHDPNETFDLVLVEYIVTPMFAFAKRFNCPHIGIASLDPPNFVYEFVGNPIHPAFDTNVLRPYIDKQTLTGRIKSVLYDLFVKVVNTFYFMPKYEALVKKHFGDNYPHLYDIATNASMLMINTNSAFHKIFPLLPNVIQIGGELHINNSLELSNELRKIMDDSEGVIYFSLGSNIQVADLPLSSQKAIWETFAELPYTVLWKWDSEDSKIKLKNVFTAKWFPQQALLRHPKVKLFITQGGRQSMDESIAFNVPMIGIPFFADQFYNVQKMVAQGYGLTLEYSNLQKADFKTTILEVIQNTKYRKQIKNLSDLASDQPMTGLERAVWWIEYVLRHNGAYHLRSPFLDIPMYQYLLLDVFGICLLTLVVILFLLYCLSKIFFSLLKKFVFKVKIE